MMKILMRQGGVRGFHMYTLNLERQVQTLILLDELSLVPLDVPRELPWRRSANEHRSQQEQVRPIFWSGRPKSYLARTRTWDEFPNGRWGDVRSAAFGEDDSSHTKLVVNCTVNQDLFHDCTTIECVIKVFALSLLEGRPLPWSEEISSETDLILSATLLPMISRGYLTINSQPRVNGVRSDDEATGWGPANGFVYQKEYVEFFCSPEALVVVEELLVSFPWITYMYCSADGTKVGTNKDGVNAVTWGVFLGREVLQPTITDLRSFLVWRPEAFSLWFSPFQQGEAVPEIISAVANTWYLVNLVDNEYVHGTFPGFLSALIEKVPQVIDVTVLSESAIKRKSKKKCGAPCSPGTTPPTTII